jgi:DNA processing protein
MTSSFLARGNQRDELVATVAILRADALSPSKLSGFLEYVGSAVDLLPTQLGGADLESMPLLLSSISAENIAVARQEVDNWEQAGFQARTILDPAYPSNLQTVFDKPPLIFVLGKWIDEVDSRAVAVVGTRSASPEGKKRAFRLASRLAQSGFTVISGLAKGIDASAHRGALEAGGRTVAVMGTGIKKRYPRENAVLAEEILASGAALVSQFFPDQPPTKWTFPVRNLTMSGLSLATIVIEAGATSGAKMQAEAALVHGRPVFLPRSLVESHDWAHQLVERGHRGAHAVQVESADDVIGQLENGAQAEALIA